MSSFYDDASLVVIPSGYKTSKIYAEKPTDGSGDLTFTRASDATRVGPDGLIEKVRTNLVLQSQNLDNASWAKTTVGGSITVTANYGAAPDGTNTADRVQISAPTAGAYADVLQTMSVTSGVELTYSVYLKSLSGTPTIIFYNDGVTGNKTATLTSSWARYTFTVSSSGTQAYPRFLVENGITSASADFLAWGAQLEYGVATAYIPTTTAAVSVGPVSNVPRLDYLGSSCPRLLLEPQRTNLALFSEQFDNAAWAKSACSITANNVVSPDGYTNADLVTSSGAAGYIYPGNTNIFGSAGGATYAYSVYAKAGTASTITILVTAAATYTAVFNLSAGTATTSTANTTVSIVSAGNGWYRCVIICASVSNQVYSELQIGRVANGLTFYLYGAQLEAGAYATSYIPTLSASVTRVADAASKTGISSLIGQTEGTIFGEFEFNYSDSTTQVLFKANQSTDANSVGIEVQGTTIKGLVNSGGANIATITGTITTGTIKAALAYKTNDMAFYVNGVQVGVDTSGSIAFGGVVDILTIGQFLFSGSSFFPASRPFNQALLFKTRLTNAQLAELTTL